MHAYISVHLSVRVCMRMFSHVQVCCDPVDYSLPSSSVYGILQERMLEGVGYHSLLQGIFPTQGLNLPLLTSPLQTCRCFTWEAPMCVFIHINMYVYIIYIKYYTYKHMTYIYICIYIYACTCTL